MIYHLSQGEAETLTYSVTRLTVATQQTFLQVSQSGYTNVIDGHASLQSWRVKIILSSELPSDLVLFVENNSMSEVYKWLKNLPGDLKLEKCSKEFESRGFHTLESLKYLRPGDIDAFFLSPEKLLLAEKRIWENQGDCRPEKQENTAKTTRTFSEVRQF